jgi:2'-5' RNA ligase
MRLFLAVDIEPQVKERLKGFVETYSRRTKAARWVKPENIHITLYFFGEVGEKNSIPLQQLISKALTAVHPFSVAIRGVSGFPSLSRPRVLWIGVDNPSNELHAMYTLVDRHLRESGIDVQVDNKGYTPHVTIARIKGTFDDKLLDELKTSEDREFGGFQVNNAVLYQSTLTREGPRYEPVKVFQL